MIGNGDQTDAPSDDYFDSAHDEEHRTNSVESEKNYPSQVASSFELESRIYPSPDYQPVFPFNYIPSASYSRSRRGWERAGLGIGSCTTNTQVQPTPSAEENSNECNQEGSQAPPRVQAVFIPGDPEVVVPPINKTHLFKERLRRFLWDYHMPLLLVFGILLGVIWPLPGAVLGDLRFGNGICLIPSTLNNSSPSTGSGNQQRYICVWTSVSNLCVAFIFLISGIGLRLDKMKTALVARKEILLGLAFIFLVTPAFGFAVAAGPKLSPPEFSFGLALFSLMPTTLSSCVIIVGYAGGNVALALLLTVTANMLAIAVLPLTVGAMVKVAGGSSAASTNLVDPLTLCLSLVFNVMIPLVSAISLKIAFPVRVEAWVARNRNVLKFFSALFNAIIPWMKVSQSAEMFSKVSGGDYVIMALAAAGLHITYLVITTVVSMKLQCAIKLKSLEEEKAVVFVGAQKSLPVALSVLDLLPEQASGKQGLVAVAMIIAQLIQTIGDSSLAVKWYQYTRPLPHFSSASAPTNEPQVTNPNEIELLPTRESARGSGSSNELDDQPGRKESASEGEPRRHSQEEVDGTALEKM